MAKCFLIWVLVIIFYFNIVYGRDLPITGKICEQALDVVFCDPTDATACDDYCINRIPKNLRIAQTQCRYNPMAEKNWCYCYYQCLPPT
ncbi:hypothetical protein ACP275_03G051200 [Erythranthe tilingii]